MQGSSVMNISAFDLRLQFAEDTKLRTPIKAVCELLGEEVSEEIEPVISREENAQFAVRWDYDEIGILKEDVGSVRRCITRFLETTENINKVAPIGNLSKRQLTVDWILPTDKKYKFKQIELKYRKVFIISNELVKGSFDSSMLLDIDCEQGTLHHQSGAMKIPQLKDDFRSFEIGKNHPRVFLFLQTEIENKQVTTYSKEDMRDFMWKSYQICKSHATHFRKVMETVL